MEIIRGACRSEAIIVVFAKHFDIEGRSQKPVGDVGRAIVIKKGQTYKGWKLDEDRFRWHCGGLTEGEWVGPVGEVIENVADIPFVGVLFTGIAGNWERERSVGAKSVDIEYKTDGQIVFTTHP